MPQPDKVSLNAVNGWRGPGAIAIALAHFAVVTDFIAIRHLEPIALLVDLFFVLSGILIAQVYTTKLSKPAAIPEYIVRRFGRIWPVQAVTLAVLVGYELTKLLSQTVTGRHFSSPAFDPNGLNLVQAISTNLLLIQSLGIHDRETWNFPSWSLSVEFVTYALFAMTCLVSPVLRRWLAVATIAASIAILMFVAPHHMRSTYDYGVFRCFAGFFAGALTHEALQLWRLPKWPMPTLVEVTAVGLVIVWMSVCVGTYLVFAAPIVISLFIVAFVNERGLLSRLLLTRPFQMMAELSFVIYMVHALVLIFLFGLLHEYARMTGTPLFVTAPNPQGGPTGTIQILHLANPAWKWMIGTVYLAVVLGIAYVTYRFVEVPGRTYFGGVAKRFAKRPSEPKIHTVSDSREPAP